MEGKGTQGGGADKAPEDKAKPGLNLWKPNGAMGRREVAVVVRNLDEERAKRKAINDALGLPTSYTDLFPGMTKLVESLDSSSAENGPGRYIHDLIASRTKSDVALLASLEYGLDMEGKNFNFFSDSILSENEFVKLMEPIVKASEERNEADKKKAIQVMLVAVEASFPR